MGFLSALTLTRVVAETGIPFFFPQSHQVQALVRLIPTAWRTAAGMYFSGVLGAWFGINQRVCIATAASQALGMNRKHRASHHAVLGAVFMALLLVSVVGAGMVHLHIAYRNARGLDGRPIAYWGRHQFYMAEGLLMETVRGVPARKVSKHVPRFLFGGGLTVLLYALCQLSPTWPLHPVGLLCVGTWSMSQIWPNVFLGWLAKTLVLKYGGVTLHRKAGNVFIGFVMGEVAAVIAWSLFAAVRAGLGMNYHVVTVLPT
jgi:hypothetical protein